jgi:spermidine synthase
MSELILEYPIRGTKYANRVAASAHILHRVSQFQVIDVYQTEAFGKMLFLDNHVQLAELDEAAYHEALVHIPLLSLHEPRRALVVGGGDGGVLREICRHASVRHIDIVEIDEQVILASKATMPQVSAGAFDDARVHLHVADAFGFLKTVAEPYDFIVMDVTDTYEGEDGELSERLFTAEFHRDCHAALAEGGMLVSQADNHVFCPFSLEEVLRTFGALFQKTGWYQALVPSFGGYSAFAWASKGAEVNTVWPNPRLETQYLNSVTWALAFSPLPFRLP